MQLKQQLLWARPFAAAEECRQALIAYAEFYSAEWLMERHGFGPPAAVRRAFYESREKLAA